MNALIWMLVGAALMAGTILYLVVTIGQTPE